MRQADGTEALARVRTLRRNATETETLLWSRLRNRQLEGFKFRHQVWLGPFIADFYCKEAKLIIEVDGSQHSERAKYDHRRSEYLAQQGNRILRFWNNEVLENLDGVLIAIRAELLSRVPSPSRPAAQAGPLPLPGRERGR